MDVKDDTTGYVKKAFDKQGQAHWYRVFCRIGEEVNGMEVVDKIGWGLLRIAGGPAWQENRQKNAADIVPKGYGERLSG